MLAPDGSIQQAEFDEAWAPLRVLARCSPSDKLTIIRGTVDTNERLMPLFVRILWHSPHTICGQARWVSSKNDHKSCRHLTCSNTTIQNLRLH